MVLRETELQTKVVPEENPCDCEKSLRVVPIDRYVAASSWPDTIPTRCISPHTAPSPGAGLQWSELFIHFCQAFEVGRTGIVWTTWMVALCARITGRFPPLAHPGDAADSVRTGAIWAGIATFNPGSRCSFGSATSDADH